MKKMEIDDLKSQRDLYQQRVNELGTEYRRLFMVLASGLFVGSLLKGLAGVSGSSDEKFGTLMIGFAAIVILANVLWSKSRSKAQRDAIIQKLGGGGKKSDYLFSVSFWDLVSLIILLVGVCIAVLGLPRCSEIFF
jgi:hypothetical protein